MSRKDYELIARILRKHKKTLAARELAGELAKNFHGMYSRFDRERFLQACGMPAWQNEPGASVEQK